MERRFDEPAMSEAKEVTQTMPLSILKPGKSPLKRITRSALQDLDVNTQTEDFTQRTSRRVSFADTHQVKEFHTDSATLNLWDYVSDRSDMFSDDPLLDFQIAKDDDIRDLDVLLKAEIKTNVPLEDNIFISEDSNLTNGKGRKRRLKKSNKIEKRQKKNADDSVPVGLQVRPQIGVDRLEEDSAMNESLQVHYGAPSNMNNAVFKERYRDRYSLSDMELTLMDTDENIILGQRTIIDDSSADLAMTECVGKIFPNDTTDFLPDDSRMGCDAGRIAQHQSVANDLQFSADGRSNVAACDLPSKSETGPNSFYKAQNFFQRLNMLNNSKEKSETNAQSHAEVVSCESKARQDICESMQQSDLESNRLDLVNTPVQENALNEGSESCGVVNMQEDAPKITNSSASAADVDISLRAGITVKNNEGITNHLTYSIINESADNVPTTIKTNHTYTKSDETNVKIEHDTVEESKESCNEIHEQKTEGALNQKAELNLLEFTGSVNESILNMDDVQYDFVLDAEQNETNNKIMTRRMKNFSHGLETLNANDFVSGEMKANDRSPIIKDRQAPKNYKSPIKENNVARLLENLTVDDVAMSEKEKTCLADSRNEHVLIKEAVPRNNDLESYNKYLISLKRNWDNLHIVQRTTDALSEFLDKFPKPEYFERLKTLDENLAKTKQDIQIEKKKQQESLLILETLESHKTDLQKQVDDKRKKLAEREKKYRNLNEQIAQCKQRADESWSFVECLLESSSDEGLNLSFFWRTIWLDIVFADTTASDDDNDDSFPKRHLKSVKLYVKKAARNSLSKLSHNFIIEAANAANITSLATTTLDLYKVVNVVSQLVSAVKQLGNELEKISWLHVTEVINDIIKIQFKNVKANSTFSLSFTILPGHYPDHLLTPIFENENGTAMETSLIDELKKIQPGGLYLTKLVAAVDNYLF